MAIDWSKVTTEDKSAQIEGLKEVLKDGKVDYFDFNGLLTKAGLKDSVADSFQSDGYKTKINDDQAEVYAEKFFKQFDSKEDAARFMQTTLESKDIQQLNTFVKDQDTMIKVSGELANLQKKGQLDNFIQNLSTNPELKEQIAVSLQSNKANITELAAAHNALSAPSPIASTKNIDPLDTIAQTTGAGSSPPLNKSASQTENIDPAQSKPALQPQNNDLEEAAFREMIAGYAERTPDDTHLIEHFVANATGEPGDPKLKEALDKFQKNNADMLKAGGEDDMMSGMLDKDKMIHDLLASYKDTPEKAYAALADDNFQMQAFLQYSPIGQAAGFILEPLLQMFGGLMGHGSNLAGWAEADFGDIMKDFKGFFSNEMGNVMGMGNNDLGLFERLGKVVNAVGYAAEDAMDITRYDRHYMKEHNPEAGKIKIKNVGDGNDVTDVTIDPKETPIDFAAIDKPIDPFDPDKPENNELNKGLGAPTINSAIT